MIQRMQGIVGHLWKKYLSSLMVDDTDIGMEGYNPLVEDDIPMDHETDDNDVPTDSMMGDTPS